MAESTKPKQSWQAPRVETLPRLADLTLQTGGGGIPGDTAFNIAYKS